MKMRKIQYFLFFAILFLSVSCSRTSYKIVKVYATRITIDSVYDKNKDSVSSKILAGYVDIVDKKMNKVIGYAPEGINKIRSEDNPLCNLITDMLLENSGRFTGKKADVSIMNQGGIRANLRKGNITVGNIYEILPFDNSLCLLNVTGSELRRILKAAAARRHGLGNVTIYRNKKGGIVDFKVGGEKIEDERKYSISTIDYLAEGNDGMECLKDLKDKEIPANSFLRDLMISYISERAVKGIDITSKRRKNIVIIK